MASSKWKFLVLVGIGAYAAIGMTGCATIEGQGGYGNFVQCDCVTAWDPQTGGKSNTINDADFQSCVFYRNLVINNPETLVGMVKQSLEVVGQQQSLDGVLGSKDGRNARYLVSQANIDFTSDQYKEYANMLFLSPFDDSKYADKFWNRAIRDKWDITWLADYSLQGEMIGHCQEFQSMVLDKLSKEQFRNWATAYYAKWDGQTSECYGLLLDKIKPVIVSRVKEQASIDLKNGSYQDVINQISGFNGYQENSQLMLDLGLAYFNLGEISQSEDILSSAKALDPSNSMIQGWLDTANDQKRKNDLAAARKIKEEEATMIGCFSGTWRISGMGGQESDMKGTMFDVRLTLSDRVKKVENIQSGHSERHHVKIQDVNVAQRRIVIAYKDNDGGSNLDHFLISSDCNTLFLEYEEVMHPIKTKGKWVSTAGSGMPWEIEYQREN